jgi:hypothetical protein
VCSVWERNLSDVYGIIDDARSYLDSDIVAILSACGEGCLIAARNVLRRAQLSNISDRIGAFEFVNGIEADLQSRHPEKFWRSSMLRRIRLIATALSSAVWLMCGQNLDASKSALDVLELLQQYGAPYRDIAGLAAIYIVAQVFLVLGDHKNLCNTLDVLESMGKTHGLSHLAIRSLGRIRTSMELVAAEPSALPFHRELRILTLYDLMDKPLKTLLAPTVSLAPSDVVFSMEPITDSVTTSPTSDPLSFLEGSYPSNLASSPFETSKFYGGTTPPLSPHIQVPDFANDFLLYHDLDT